MKLRATNQEGFLLIAILIAILIIGFLAGGFYMSRIKYAQETKKQSKQQLENIEKQTEQQMKTLESQINDSLQENIPK